MNATGTKQAEIGTQVSQAVLPAPGGLQRGERMGENLAQGPALGPRRVGYGLPCAKCKTYYAADLKCCPVCKSTERVSPNEAEVPNTAATVEQMPDPELLEEERERFLRDFQAKVMAAPMQIQASESFACDLTENHQGGFEPACICRSCYERAVERANLTEAALHIDLKEAAAIVYEAVWADPADTTKTYSNAAHALLTELRRRAGLRLVLGPLQPLTH
ncbi:MAG TPA: hypothetical protein VH744_02855 [Terriglobales bacterium]